MPTKFIFELNYQNTALDQDGKGISMGAVLQDDQVEMTWCNTQRCNVNTDIPTFNRSKDASSILHILLLLRQSSTITFEDAHAVKYS